MPFRKRRSLFSDSILTKNSIASSLCDLYFPEPELKYDKSGAVNGVCLSGEDQTLLWSKRCIVHLCEIPLVPADFILTLSETGQENKICLNVTLNQQQKDLQYSITDTSWHECKQKTGGKWRKFLLKFDASDEEFTTFQTKLINILSLVETGKTGKCTYMLVAVQVPSSDVIPKPNVLRKSISDSSVALDTSNRGSAVSDRSSPTDPLVNRNSDIPLQSLRAPFDPAPYLPITAELITNNSVETTKYPDYEKFPPSSDVVTKVNFPLFDSLHIHPSELPRKLDSILNSVDSVFQTDASGYYEPIHSEFLLTDDTYVQMGARNKMDAKTTPNAQLQEEVATKTAKLLQTAINDGDQNHAKEYAAKLAAENVLVTINIRPKETPEKDQEFNLKVYIEDKEASGGNITLKVKFTDTIRDLKNKMLMKHMFPVEVQSWIIGKRIPPDTDTLAQCRIKSTGFSAFLYLTSARSAGLNREEFQERWAKATAPTDVKPTELPPPPTPATAGSSPGSLPGSRHSPTPPPLAHKQEPTVELRSKPTPAPKHTFAGHKFPPQPRTRETSNEIKDMMGQLQQVQLAGSGDSSVSYDEAHTGWACTACTYINQPTRPGCEVCANPRPAEYKVPDEYVITEKEKQRLKRESLLEKQAQAAEEIRVAEEQRQRKKNYELLQDTDARDLIPTAEPFTCPICFDIITAADGVMLRECLHVFCRKCLSYAVEYAEDAVLLCPYQDESYTCNGTLQDREIKALVTAQMYDRYLARSLKTAESQAANSFHCKTADCAGWCIYEDHVNFFVCPVCRKENCLTCKAIHQGMNCMQYQEDVRIRSQNDRAAGQTQSMIQKMLDDGDAMNCPQCRVIVMKKEGCDWIQCSICKTEICWVTKGPRWGELGNGDISGGCLCRVNGETCHPNCSNCH